VLEKRSVEKCEQVYPSQTLLLSHTDRKMGLKHRAITHDSRVSKGSSAFLKDTKAVSVGEGYFFNEIVLLSSWNSSQVLLCKSL